MAKPELVFSPYAWWKLNFMCHVGSTEVAGFAIGSDKNPMYIVDFKLIPQTANAAYFEFTDEGFADHLDGLEEHKLDVRRHNRIWVHTHPGDSPTPSTLDEQTLREKFGKYPWIVMLILARDGSTYARLRIQSPTEAQSFAGATELIIPVRVDYKAFADGDMEDMNIGDLKKVWDKEYRANVTEQKWELPTKSESPHASIFVTGNGKPNITYYPRGYSKPASALEESWYGSFLDKPNRELSDIDNDERQAYIESGDWDMLTEEMWQKRKNREHRSYDEPVDPRDIGDDQRYLKLALEAAGENPEDGEFDDFFPREIPTDPRILDRLIDTSAYPPGFDEVPDDDEEWAREEAGVGYTDRELAA